ncbi:MAG: hypothetical protein OXC46_04930 [Thaumarchaeota archaeon]|nr:hypothetical protein [Nitrososphaerota archaeon]
MKPQIMPSHMPKLAISWILLGVIQACERYRMPHLCPSMSKDDGVLGMVL